MCTLAMCSERKGHVGVEPGKAVGHRPEGPEGNLPSRNPDLGLQPPDYEKRVFVFKPPSAGISLRPPKLRKTVNVQA